MFTNSCVLGCFYILELREETFLHFKRLLRSIFVCEQNLLKLTVTTRNTLVLHCNRFSSTIKQYYIKRAKLHDHLFKLFLQSYSRSKGKHVGTRNKVWEWNGTECRVKEWNGTECRVREWNVTECWVRESNGTERRVRKWNGTQSWKEKTNRNSEQSERGRNSETESKLELRTNRDGWNGTQNQKEKTIWNFVQFV